MRITDVALWLVLLPAAAAVVAGLTALHHRRRATRGAQRVAQLEQQLRVRDEETLHLLHNRLRAMADAQWRDQRAGVPGGLHKSLSGTEFANAHDSVVEMFGEATESAEQAAESLLLAVARKLQGLANGQQLKINEMTERHDDAVFLEDLMHLDHTNAQILRRAVGMAVACRAWPGRQHNPTPLHDIVRGAIGRILDYKRVHIVRIEDTRAVTGRVVEPLVMTIAELLENATRSSHPQTPVQVHVQLTHSGLAFVIEDAGVGLNAAEQEKAARLLNDDSLGIGKLGDPPRFGLAACGALARRYGFTVSVDTASAFGGVRAVVNLPRTLLTDPVRNAPVRQASRRPEPVEQPAATGAGGAGATTAATPDTEPAPAERAPAPAAMAAESDGGSGHGGSGHGGSDHGGSGNGGSGSEDSAARPATTAHGLPKRTRKQADPDAGRPQEPAPAPRAAPRSPSQAAASIGAFQRAGKAAADRLRPSTEGTPES